MVARCVRLQVPWRRRRVDDHKEEKGMEFLVFSIIIAALLVLVAPRFIPPQFAVLNVVAKAAALLLILFAVASTSFVYIDEDKTGHINKIYGSNLPPGAYIAIKGEKGPQAYLLPPGFQFSPLLNKGYLDLSLPNLLRQETQGLTAF